MVGCNSDKKDELATIDENFRLYFSEAFKKSLDLNLSYYVLDMEGCSDCVEEHFEYLDSLDVRENVIFIIAGRVTKKEWLIKLNELQVKNEILFDNSTLSKKYYFGLNKPLFFFFFYN